MIEVEHSNHPCFVGWEKGALAPRPQAVIPRHRVSPSASPMTGSSGVSSTPRLLDSITGVSGILGRPVKPGDDGWGCGAFIRNEIVTDSIFQTANKRYDFAISRRDVPEFCKNCFASPWNRGRGECRVPNAPAASRAKLNKAHERSHHRSTGTPGIPARDGFTAYFVLSPATNSSCHRRPRIKVLSARSGRLSLRELNTSNGCQNHTASPSAAPRLSQRLRRAKRRSSACHSSAHGPYRPALPSPDIA